VCRIILSKSSIRIGMCVCVGGGGGVVLVVLLCGKFFHVSHHFFFFFSKTLFKDIFPQVSLPSLIFFQYPSHCL